MMWRHGHSPRVCGTFFIRDEGRESDSPFANTSESWIKLVLDTVEKVRAFRAVVKRYPSIEIRDGK